MLKAWRGLRTRAAELSKQLVASARASVQGGDKAGHWNAGVVLSVAA